jgi:hypothetical protein
MRRVGWLVLAGLAGCNGGGAADDPPARKFRETSHGGVVATVPHIGTIAWQCDERQRYSTRLVLPSPGATVFVNLTTEGHVVWRQQKVDPDPSGRPTVVGPFPVKRRQAWRIYYNHEPATVTAIARLRVPPPSSRAQCVVSRARLNIKRTAH